MILEKVLDWWAARELVEEQIPTTRRYFFRRIVLLVAMIGAMVARGYFGGTPLWFVPFSAAIGWYVGVGTLAPMRRKSSYQRGFTHGYYHPDHQ